ncbi:AAA family ATPase [Fibrobacter sp. UWB12]|uniref:AAA family ATPase n=1 Tax=Fibrobacter sp. UWB12 TaxID=1896203 RepID=UPI000919FA63|nr:AAA family ATPase [Fibrobacter sp. UWB12]SHK35678.1 AAA domain (dynein-related subfamily) [Fibrobacter sp. UWB12]
MSVRINARELESLLAATPASQNIMLTGKHGIGKSQILEKFFTARGERVMILFLGQMSDPGDLIGLPRLDETTGKTLFMPPYWFPTDGKPVVLFLDELNRARPEVLQTIMDLTLNRTLAGRKLPEGSRVISAVNDGEEYQLTDLDPALVSRFNIYEFKPTTQEWLLWAAKAGLDSRVIDFISENPEMLDGAAFTREDQGLEKSPDRRGWERVSNVLQTNEVTPLLKIVIAGIVGMPAATKFFATINQKRLPSAKEILLGDFAKLQTALKKCSTPELASVNESILRFIETKSYDEKDDAKVSKNVAAYFEFLSGENFREAQAHFANLYSSSLYPSTMTFVIMQCPDLYKKITAFVKSI